VSSETVFRNANIVLETEIICGSVQIRDGLITDVAQGASTIGEDFGSDYLLPGLVELHTDHLEGHYSPRPGLRWNVMAAIQSHDAQIAASGITTVLDCLRLGTNQEGGEFEDDEMRRMANALKQAGAEGRLRAEHLLHLRCEVSASDVIDHFSRFDDVPEIRLVSLMDHAPGQRQFQSMEQYTLYYKTMKGLSDEAFEVFVKNRIARSQRYSDPHRKMIARMCNERGIPMASHDDATLEHVSESISFGVRLAEFPTSLEAARASHEAGLSVLMGAPNVVRGRSHSGNVAASDLAEAGVLDVLSSDYVPFSIIHAPFILADTINITLPEAIAMVTASPARAVDLHDRGRIAPDLRADLVRVRHTAGDVPLIRSVWRQGQRVS
jgi:alpha-D-ribose 1-methylphosphonate 5-triphosphate diphosphatase